jgi:uncharacterized protein YjbI with pentapeptide repeats
MKLAFCRKRPPGPQNDEWLETHVKRNEGSVFYVRAGSEEGANIDEVREDLRRRYREYLNRELPDRMRAILGELGKFDHHPPDADDEKQRQHRALIAEWNRQWAEYVGIECDTIPPSLSGLSFNLKNLVGIDLTNADLRPIEGLRGLGSDHWRANFNGAILTQANLEANKFGEADLRDANLIGTRLVDARLVKAKLQCAKLIGADLRRAVLDDADLTGADLWGADLTGASISNAILDGADLRFAQGIVVDRNSVYRTKFSTGMWVNRVLRYRYYRRLRARGAWDPKRPISRREMEDVWSGLRRVYTGPNFFISLLFLFAFAGSFLVRAAVLDQIGKSEAAVIAAAPPSLREELSRWVLSGEEAAKIRTRVPEEYQEIEGSFANMLIETRNLSRDVLTVRNESADAAGAITLIAEIASQLQQNQTVLVDLNADLTGLLQNDLSSAKTAQIHLRLPIEYARVAESLGNLLQSAHLAERLASELPVVASGVASIKNISQSIDQINSDARKTLALVAQFRSDLTHLLATSVAQSRWKIWQVLLGLDAGNYYGAGLIVTLMLYNMCKWVLTTTVAPLRDLEDRSHTSPSRAEYYPLRRIDWVVSRLFWISLITGIVGFIVLLGHNVYIFW